MVSVASSSRVFVSSSFHDLDAPSVLPRLLAIDEALARAVADDAASRFLPDTGAKGAKDAEDAPTSIVPEDALANADAASDVDEEKGNEKDTECGRAGSEKDVEGWDAIDASKCSSEGGAASDGALNAAIRALTFSPADALCINCAATSVANAA